MTIYSMWVHGTVVQAQHPNAFDFCERYGWGATFAARGGEWFHIAIPTPVVVADQKTHLQKAHIFYRSAHGAKITARHIYDGPERIFTFDGGLPAGDHGSTEDAFNTLDLSWLVKAPGPHITRGLGFSVYVEFGQGTGEGLPEITFTSFGAEFSLV